MPQVDLTCGGDPCENTLIGSQPIDPLKPSADPDFPPESFSIPLDIDHWLLDTYPVIYNDDDSTRGTTNPKSRHQHHDQNVDQEQNHSAKRFSGNLKATAKAPIIALPNAVQRHSGYLGRSSRRRPVYRVRVSDPGSPEVSCLGKVLSRREKSAGRRGRWAAVLGCFGGWRAAEPPVRERNIPARTGDVPMKERDVPVAAPGLGGVKKFVSGRRTESWGCGRDGDLDQGGHAVCSGPLDR